MSPDAAENWLARSRARVEAELARALPGDDVAPIPLHQAMRYAALDGGKRLRAMLAFASAEALGHPPERALPVAAAVELLHAYSLVHDDLPAMDDARMRRGKPAVHVRYGEAAGILVGDALLALAFEVLAGPGVPVELVHGLARAAGSQALVGGQADDLGLKAPGDDLPGRADVRLDAIVSVHARKTVALFAFAVEGAARLCPAAEAEVEALGSFARHYGHAYQIADDLDDAGDPDPCSILQALDAGAAALRGREHVASARRALERFGARAASLAALVDALERRLS